MASTTAPPTITAPAANTAIPWSRRTGNDSLKPAIRLTAPRPMVSAASAENRMRRRVGGWDCIGDGYPMVRAITRRWISLVPS